MATPSQIQADARRKYNATGDTFFTDSDFYDLIYEAETILAEEALVIEKVYSTTSVASQREYSWPTTAIAIKRIEYDGNKLRYSTFREDDSLTLSQSDTTDTGTPDFYQLWDRTIYLRPIPGTASLTIRIFTYDRPNLQTTGSANLDTPEHYRKDIVNYVLAHMAMKDGNTNVAQSYFNRWDQAVKRAIRWQRKRRGVDGPKRTQNVDDLPQTHLGLT
jgi:hypothetical protein